MSAQRLRQRLPDRRNPDRIQHSMREMVMQRVSAIAYGCEGANDLDRLRHDPVMNLALGHCPEGAAGVATDRLPRREFAEQDCRGAGRLRSGGSVLRDRDARQGLDCHRSRPDERADQPDALHCELLQTDSNQGRQTARAVAEKGSINHPGQIPRPRSQGKFNRLTASPRRGSTIVPA
jgi:hypothetical protein